MSDLPCRTCGTLKCYHKRNGRRQGRVNARTRFQDAEYQQAARSHVRRESLQRSGALGFAGLAAKHGYQYAAEQVARWRRAHPSSLERAVMGWLDELGERYEHDRPFAGYMVYPDFRLDARQLVIEVDGRGWHEQTDWLNDGGWHAAQDAMKDALYTREGYRVLRLSERSVRDGSGKAMLIDFVARKGQCE